MDKETLDTATVLVVSEKGYGKRSYLVDPETKEDEYRVTGRGGKGVKTLNVTEKTGDLIAIKNVSDEDGLMIINKSGLTIRMRVDALRTMGRATQGVRLINIKDSDAIASVAVVPVEEEEEEILENTEAGVVTDINSSELPESDDAAADEENGITIE